MIEVCTHNFLLFKRKEFWFYNKEEISAGTYNVFCYSLEKNLPLKKKILPEQSSIINLRKTEQELFADINRTFSYHIKKAEKLGVTFNVKYSPTNKEVNFFITEFSNFASNKKIEWNKNRVLALQKLNRLIISETWLNNKKICTHVYLHDTQQVLLLHSYHSSTNFDSNTRGYANKFLHWNDILTFKKQGFTTFDFGGINFEKHPGITRFKLSFGGEVIDRHSYIEVNPLLDWGIKLYKKAKS